MQCDRGRKAVINGHRLCSRQKNRAHDKVKEGRGRERQKLLEKRREETQKKI
jgi:hypothetical protein